MADYNIPAGAVAGCRKRIATEQGGAGVTAREVVVAHYAHEALRREREWRVAEADAYASIGGDPTAAHSQEE